MPLTEKEIKNGVSLLYDPKNGEELKCLKGWDIGYYIQKGFLLHKPDFEAAKKAEQELKEKIKREIEEEISRKEKLHEKEEKKTRKVKE